MVHLRLCRWFCVCKWFQIQAIKLFSSSRDIFQSRKRAPWKSIEDCHSSGEGRENDERPYPSSLPDHIRILSYAEKISLYPDRFAGFSRVVRPGAEISNSNSLVDKVVADAAPYGSKPVDDKHDPVASTCLDSNQKKDRPSINVGVARRMVLKGLGITPPIGKDAQKPSPKASSSKTPVSNDSSEKVVEENDDNDEGDVAACRMAFNGLGISRTIQERSRDQSASQVMAQHASFTCAKTDDVDATKSRVEDASSVPKLMDMSTGVTSREKRGRTRPSTDPRVAHRTVLRYLGIPVNPTIRVDG